MENPIPRGFQGHIGESSQPPQAKKPAGENTGSVSTGPTPALFTLRSSIPSRSPSARAQARTVLPPSAHRLHPASQPARSHDHTPILQPHPSEITRQHTPAHPLPPSRMRTRTRAHPHARTRITRVHFRVTRPDARTCPRSCVAHTVEVIHRVAVYVEGWTSDL